MTITYESFLKRASILENGRVRILPENNLESLRKSYPGVSVKVFKTSLFK